MHPPRRLAHRLWRHARTAATGEPGETAVQIPVTITWVSGGLYQIWLVALNSKGPSAPGPIQSWTAP